MPKDKRLWMTFPIDFHHHPKVRRLSVEARWTFVEMNGEARLADNDGVFDAEEAEFEWSADVLAELVASHPSRPLVERRGSSYVIRDYAEHQETRADREERVRRARENGAKGGRPRKNPPGSKSVASGLQTKPSRNPEEPRPNQSQSQSQSSTYVPESQSLDNRANDSTDAFPISDSTRRMASQAGITDLHLVADMIRENTGRVVDAAGAMAVSSDLIGKAKSHPKNPQAYVISCLVRSSAEVQQFIDERALGEEAS